MQFKKGNRERNREGELRKRVIIWTLEHKEPARKNLHVLYLEKFTRQY